MKSLNMRFQSLLSATLFFTLAAAAAVSAQETTEKLPPFIRTTAESVIYAQPDRAQIDVGVVTQADTSQSAASQNAQKADASIASLRRLLGASADIKTISYSVSPNYRYPKEGGNPTITGYTATNIVRVTLDDLSKVGSVIDTAVAGGSNNIQNLRFTLRDEKRVTAQALSDAASAARLKADALAAALKLRIAGVLSVVEGGSPVYPMRDVAFAARAEAKATPIDPGTIEVRASVTLTVQVVGF